MGGREKGEAMSTKIEWASESWNPVVGCTKISAGCQHCYALRFAVRLAHNPKLSVDARERYMSTVHKANGHWEWTGRMALFPERLEQPLHWRKLRRVFTVSMGDFFHCLVPFSFQCEILQVIGKCPQHTFLILTKRTDQLEMWEHAAGWHPYPNLWLGVTAENQEQADKRIPVLLQTPAAKRWVSLEPMLEEIDLHWISSSGYRMLSRWYGPDGFDETGSQPERNPLWPNWVVLGGESGPGAHPLHPDSVRSVRDQCVEAGVPFLFKQWGAWFPRDQWEHSPELMLPDDDEAYQPGPRTHIFPDGTVAHRIGKKRAGRLLDGQLWDQYPT